MWGLRWKQGTYRLENLDAGKREQAIRAGEAQSEMLKKHLAEVGCQWCKEHHEPIVNSRGMCAYCEDQLFG